MRPGSNKRSRNRKYMPTALVALLDFLCSCLDTRDIPLMLKKNWDHGRQNSSAECPHFKQVSHSFLHFPSISKGTVILASNYNCMRSCRPSSLLLSLSSGTPVLMPVMTAYPKTKNRRNHPSQTYLYTRASSKITKQNYHHIS